MSFKPYSFSKISVYENCPRQFKYKYIDKLPTAPKDMTPLLKGSAVHNILENYPNKGTHKLQEKYQFIVDEFLDSDYKKLFDYPNLREQAIALDDTLSPKPYGKNVLFRGYIDYMCFIDGILHIIDWKTGKLKDLKYQNFNQLLFYSIYMFKKYPKVNQIKIRYVYIEHKLENSILLDRKYLSKYINDLITIIDKIENEKTFPKNKQVLCNWCDYQEFCNNDSL